MSKIKFFALGGLEENGKNMYVLEVNDDIYILDSGSKTASHDQYGIDSVIPNTKYIYENKDRIKAIFITHGHDDHMGAILEVLKICHAKVFASHFTISLIEDKIKDAFLPLEDFKLFRINEDKILTFDNLEVCCYNVCHSIPEALNFVFKTKDGNIYYCPDFTFDVTNSSKYHTSFNKLSSYQNNKTLFVAAESLGSLNYNRVNNDTQLDIELDNILKESGRIIFTCYSEELSRIQKVIDKAVEKKKKIAIIGLKAQKIIAKGIETGYLNIPEQSLINLKYITEDEATEKKTTPKNLVVIVTGANHTPFYSLIRMCKGEDRLIRITKSDHIVIMSPKNGSTERIAVQAKNEIFKLDAKYSEISRTILKSTHADSNDLQLLYSITSPKYIIPIEGDNERLYAHKQIAKSIGIDDSKIKLLENGQVALFEDGEFVNDYERVSATELLVDGSIMGRNSNEITKTREVLALDGMVLVNIALDFEKTKIMSLPDCIIKGVTLQDEDLKEQIITCVLDEIQVQFNRHKFVDKDYMNERLKTQIQTVIKKECKKAPLVVLNFIDLSK